MNQQTSVRSIIFSISLSLTLISILIWGTGTILPSLSKPQEQPIAQSMGYASLLTRSPQSRPLQRTSASAVYTPSIALLKMTNGIHVNGAPGPSVCSR